MHVPTVRRSVTEAATETAMSGSGKRKPRPRDCGDSQTGETRRGARRDVLTAAVERSSGLGRRLHVVGRSASRRGRDLGGGGAGHGVGRGSLRTRLLCLVRALDLFETPAPERRPAPGTQRPVRSDQLAALRALSVQPPPAGGAHEPVIAYGSGARGAAIGREVARRGGDRCKPPFGHRGIRSDDPINDHGQRKKERAEENDLAEGRSLPSNVVPIGSARR